MAKAEQPSVHDVCTKCGKACVVIVLVPRNLVSACCLAPVKFKE